MTVQAEGTAATSTGGVVPLFLSVEWAILRAKLSVCATMAITGRFARLMRSSCTTE